MKVVSFFKKIENDLIAYRRSIYYKHLRKKNKNKDMSIIAQNCVGGVIYSELGMRFNSPTINMFIEDENFVKLVENLEYYLSIEASPLTECYIDPIDSTIRYPKIKIDDIEICCLHYKNCEEAIENWEKRKKRVKLDNIYVIGNSWNMHGREELIMRIAKCKYKSIVFTYEKYEISNCVQLKGKRWRLDDRGIIRPNITDFAPHSIKYYFEKQFDIIKFFNS